MNVTVDDLNQSYMIAAGATWVDFAGNTMWKGDGSITSSNITNKDSKTGQYTYNFEADPFTEAVYGLKRPTFTLLDENNNPITKDKYVKLNSSTGEVTFTEDARQAQFKTPYVVGILIKATSPWGSIADMDEGNQVKMTLTIAADAQ